MPILTAALLLLGQAAQTPAPAAQKPVDLHLDHPARKLFLANCAQCHGESGDGKGTTKLDRDPRNFQAGGFSYGNTPEAIARTITYGIPGSPMPSFEKALKDAERRQLAEYVLLLGPEQPKTDPKESVLVVGDKPLVVRGKLPPVVEGGPAFPRGLLVGTPEGLSFEYRVDDVRLLAVLKGEFADRADWRGRGGDALVPLGKAVHVLADKEDGWIFSRYGELARRQLRSTELSGAEARLHYDLLGPAGERIASVVETPRTFACSLGGGYARRFRLEPGEPQSWDPKSPQLTNVVRGALAELRLRRQLPVHKGDVLVGTALFEEITLPGVLWPADPAEQRKLTDTFLAEAVR